MSSERGAHADAARAREELLVTQLGAALPADRALEAVLRDAHRCNLAARRRLDAIEAEIRQAATRPGLDTAAGRREFQTFLTGKTREIHTVVTRAADDSRAKAGTIRALTGRYTVGGYRAAPPPLPGDSGDVARVVGDDRAQPWQYPWDPPPPSDSAPGGGYWDISDQPPYPSGPDGGLPMGPIASPAPWHRKVSPVTGASSGLEETVNPHSNGWGVDPAATLQEAYRFRVVGEGFTGAPGHVRWVQRDGKWHQAKWVGYDFEAEHVRAVVPHNDAEGVGPMPWGMSEWRPIGIHDIYKLQADNPRLTLSLPTPLGDTFRMPAGAPALTAGR